MLRDGQHFFLSQAAHPYAIFKRYHVRSGAVFIRSPTNEDAPLTRDQMTIVHMQRERDRLRAKIRCL